MIEDEMAVQRVINTYAQNTGRNWDAVIALFLPDATWEVPHLGLVFTGLDEIRGALLMLAGDLEWVLQLNSPAIVDVAGDTATARSGIREAGKRKDADQCAEYFGIYADTLRRTPDGWKFARRVFEHIGTQHALLAAAPA
jgi:ketosteroid isomerase-like protein